MKCHVLGFETHSALSKVKIAVYKPQRSELTNKKSKFNNEEINVLMLEVPEEDLCQNMKTVSKTLMQLIFH